MFDILSFIEVGRLYTIYLGHKVEASESFSLALGHLPGELQSISSGKPTGHGFDTATLGEP